jgi:hypothetical protein
MNEEKIQLPNTPYAGGTNFIPVVRVLRKISRNVMCPVLNKKFKKCCGATGQNYCNKAKENLETYLNDLKNND